MTTIIKKVVMRDRHFTLVKDDDGNYLSIEDKYIDENGRLNRTLRYGHGRSEDFAFFYI